jgi:inner membrane protein
MIPIESKPLAFWGLSVVLATAPDLDVLAFRFGIPYGARFGHRGFFHSLFFAALASLPIALLTVGAIGLAWWLLWGYCFVVLASHGLLDAFTNGGMGIGLLSPFDDTRYFFPWQPIQVSPIGWACFSRWGLRALASEVIWVWVPLAVLVGGAWLARSV